MRSRLPVGVAAFVGRERERAKVADLVADARVVTLTGSGGCGKTRLSELDDPDGERGRHLEFHVGLAGRATRSEQWTTRA